MRRSVENGRNFKSFSGFRISCKSSTCLSTFVIAILSALLVMIMHGKSFFIMCLGIIDYKLFDKWEVIGGCDDD